MANNVIARALQLLGIRGKVALAYVQPDRVAVAVDGEYIGLWAVDRNTFVD